MKIVLDTNVFISGIFWKGKPHSILKLWAEGKIQIFITENILNEYLRVLKKIDGQEKVILKWAAFVVENSILLKDSDIIQTCRDPDDNKFLNCATSGKVDFLVSGDDDLLSLSKIATTKIVNSNDFLNIFKKLDGF